MEDYRGEMIVGGGTAGDQPFKSSARSMSTVEWLL
jgi:hypothetical protein